MRFSPQTCEVGSVRWGRTACDQDMALRYSSRTDRFCAGPRCSHRVLPRDLDHRLTTGCRHLPLPSDLKLGISYIREGRKGGASGLAGAPYSSYLGRPKPPHWP